MKPRFLLQSKWLLIALFSALLFQPASFAAGSTYDYLNAEDQCYCKVEADFSANFGIVDPCTLFFSDQSITNSCTNITDWFWDFGDGTTSTASSTGHTYSGDGTYYVCLTVVANNGIDRCVDTYCDSVKISGCTNCSCKLESDFNYIFNYLNRCEVSFNEQAVTNSCTNITSYSWDFGDGTSSNAANPTHVYSGNGTYVVCLTVVGNNGVTRCADTYCDTITISGCTNCSCKLESDFNYIFNYQNRCEVTFNEQAVTNSCTNITSYSWDFGDGTSSNVTNPTHVYSGNGTYVVCLTVVGNNGVTRCADTYCDTITITGCTNCSCKLESDFNFLFNAQNRCQVAFFENGKTNSCTNITSYSWDFGDGTSSNLANPVHNYSSGGTYTVCLTVVGNNGVSLCADTYCETITLNACYFTPKTSSGQNSDLLQGGLEAEVYPNPFSETLTIRFYNPADQNVDILLLDATGKQIKSIGSEVYAQGNHEFSFSASDENLTNGVYFISVKAGDEYTYQKVVLSK